MRIALILTLALATPALADEMWDSDMGLIEYAADINGAAVFNFTNVDGYPAVLVIPGLAGNYDNRSTHPAYWVGTGAGECPSFLDAPGAAPSSQWGTAQISFDQPGFPTSFSVSMGYCLEPHSFVLRAEAAMN